MQPLNLQELERLLEIMRDMHDISISDNWQELARLDSERRALLRFDATVEVSDHLHQDQSTLIPKPLAPAEPVDTDLPVELSHRDSLIQEILSLDAQILEVVQSKRQRLLDENRGLSAQLKAKQLYAKTSSMT